jgi:hypothetical protein
LLPAHSVFLGTYTFTVNAARVLDPLPLDDRDLPRPFFQWARSTLKPGRYFDESERSNACHEISEITVEKGHTIAGFIDSGPTGVTSRVVHNADGSHKYSKARSDADLAPFYFQAYVRPGADRGILVLQKRGMSSPFAFFDDVVRRLYSEENQPFILKLHPHLPKDVQERLAEGVVRQIRAVKFDQRSDVADRLLDDGNNPADYILEHVVRARPKKPLIAGTMRKYLRSIGFQGRGELPAEWKEHYDLVTVTLSTSRKKNRTFTFGTGREVLPYEEVTDRVTIDEETGHPTFATIHRVANEYVTLVEQDLGWE